MRLDLKNKCLSARTDVQPFAFSAQRAYLQTKNPSQSLLPEHEMSLKACKKMRLYQQCKRKPTAHSLAINFRSSLQELPKENTAKCSNGIYHTPAPTSVVKYFTVRRWQPFNIFNPSMALTEMRSNTNLYAVVIIASFFVSLAFLHDSMERWSRYVVCHFGGLCHWHLHHFQICFMAKGPVDFCFA